MRRSVQEIVELLVFGLIALLIGTALLWLAGWVFDLVGVLLKFFAGLIWSLLRFIVPVAVVAAIVYVLVRLVQQQRIQGARRREATEPAAERDGGPDTSRSEPGTAKPTVSEIWAPPQPSPPAAAPRNEWAPDAPEVGESDGWEPGEDRVEAGGSWTAGVGPDERGEGVGNDASTELTGIAGTEATPHPAPLGHEEQERAPDDVVVDEAANEPIADDRAPEGESEAETDIERENRS
jgi:uncharacterized membrane protein